MRRVLTLGVAFVVCPCSTAGAKTANHDPPALSRGGAERLMLGAEDIKGSALDGLEPVRLAEAFRGSALAIL